MELERKMCNIMLSRSRGGNGRKYKYAQGRMQTHQA